jgi:hypothetical protein
MWPFASRAFRRLSSVAVLSLVAASADADPLSFGDVRALWSIGNQNIVLVNLFSETPLVLSGQQVDFGGGVTRAVVTFEVGISGVPPPGETDTLRLTYGLPAFDHPFSNVVQEFTVTADQLPNTVVFGMDYPLLYRPERTTLTVDFLKSAPDFVIPSGSRAGQAVNSFTYEFSVVQPVPEPASILLIGAGLSAAVLGRHRARCSSRPSPKSD